MLMYSIDVDRGRRIVRAHLSGFFTSEEVAAFAREEQAAAASLMPGGVFGLLLDATGATAQAQDIVAAFHGLFHDLPIKAARIAVVTNSALLTIQLRRMSDPARTRVFEAVGAAAAWLGDSLRPLDAAA